MENIQAFNEDSFQELSWAIATSQGEFSLILAHCNSASLRQRLTQKLQADNGIEIREIVLEQSIKTLYTKIQTELGDRHPQALIVSGLESLKTLNSVLTGANQIREEFRKNFPFPIVLWVTDEVLQKLIRLAHDLQSWTTSVEFAIPSEDLIEIIQKTADEVFTKVLVVGAGRYVDNTALNLGIGSPRRTELEVARTELRNRSVELHPEIEAGLEFVLGRDISGSLELSRLHYERSFELLELAQAGEDMHHSSLHPPQSPLQERRACLLYCMGLWWRTYAVLHHTEGDRAREHAKEYFQECLSVFEEVNRQDLVANFINGLGAVLQRLQLWDELEATASKAVTLHQTYPHEFRLARAYGFQAEFALAKSAWQEAQEKAKQAVEILETAANAAEKSVSPETLANLEWERSYHWGWYLFALARAELGLGEKKQAITTLETAKAKIKQQYDPELYIRILQELRHCYFEDGEYLTAFNLKQEQRGVEQKYGFRAFVGAGRLQPTQQITNPGLALVEQKETVAQEIAATGREQDIKRLAERMGCADRKLTIIYGQSGVGKSSILQAGLIPVLKSRAIGTRDVVPVLQQVYADWMEELGDRLAEGFADRRACPLTESSQEEAGLVKGIDLENHDFLGEKIKFILEQLHTNAEDELLTVLMFDQFEEFFFVYKDPKQRLIFYNFLRDCLDVPHVRVILSLREDYLYYLLECNDRLTSLEVINNNILDKDVLYYLGNFSRSDTKSLIKNFTQRTQLVLAPTLIDALVEDLAGDFGEIRPIELQVVGTQLQTDKITTIEQYQESGPKEKLVGRFLAEVVNDCGEGNEQIAKLVLYLLTDENNTRPLKTRADLELELDVKSEKLDVVLLILVKSGLVFKIPAVPRDRYQLVHDYLVTFVRQQQSARLIAELEKEREQRKLTEAKLNHVLKQQLKSARRATFTLGGLLVAIGGFALIATATLFNTYITSQTLASSKKSELDRLVLALKTAKEFQKLSIAAIPETRYRVLTELSQAVYGVTEHNRLEGHTDGVTSVSFSPDGQRIASASKDKTIKLWDLKNRQDVKTFVQHTDAVTSVSFSPDGQVIASASKDKTVKLWNLDGTLLKDLKHNQSVINVIFSPNGKMLAAASEDNTVKIWTHEGSRFQNLNHQDSLVSIVFSPDSKMIATASKDDIITLWDIDGNKLKEINNYGAINLRFSHDGKMIIATNKNGRIKFYDHNGILLKNSQLTVDYSPADFTTASFSSDGIQQASVAISPYDKSQGNKVYLSRNDSSNIGESLTGHSEKINYLSFSHDGKVLASASDDKSIRLWNIDNNSNKFSIGARNSLSDVRFSPDGKAIITTDSDHHQVKLWNSDGKLIGSAQEYDSPPQLSPDGKIFTSGAETFVKRLLTINGKEISLKNERSENISDINFSPNSKILAALYGDNTISVWQSDGTLVKTLKGNTAKVSSFSFSPDSKIIAVISNDNVVRLWKDDGTPIKSLESHSGQIKNLIFSPDSQIIVSIDHKQIANIWRSDGTFIKTLDEPIEGDNNITFSRDSKMIITSRGNSGKVKINTSDATKVPDLNGQIVKLWRSDGTLLQTLDKRHIDGISSITFSPDNKFIISTGDDNIVNLWDSNGNFIKRMVHAETVAEVIFSHDGSIIASLSSSVNSSIDSNQNSTIKLWRTNGKIIETIDSYGLSSIKFSPDSSLIAGINNNNSVQIWSVNGTVHSTLRGHNDKIASISFSPDSQFIASNSKDNTVRLWNLKRKDEKEKILRGFNCEHEFSEFCELKYSEDGKILTAVNTSYTPQDHQPIYKVKIWNRDGKELSTITGLREINWSDNFQLISSVTQDSKSNYTVKFWDAQGKEIKAFKGEGVSSPVFSPDGKIVALTTVKNYYAKIWDIDGVEITKIKGHNDPINSISMSHDGQTIASASDDNTVKIWNKKGVIQRTLEGHTKKITSVAFNPVDGEIIASASDDNQVILWNIKGKRIRTLKGIKGKVKSVIFSPNGKIIAAASDDKIINLWNIGNDDPFKSLEEANGRISFSPDSNMLLVGDKFYFLNSIWFNETESLPYIPSSGMSSSLGDKLIAVADEDKVSVLSWNLDNLLIQGCDRARDYLKNNPKVSKSDRTLCDDIPSQKSTSNN
jgi:WD40 repeat protein/tetratricopeptide (TPR) repeat protein